MCAGARWFACLVVLGSRLLSPSGAHAQADPAAANSATGPVAADPNDPNAIRGIHLETGIEVDEILTDNANGVANGGSLTSSAGGTTTTSSASKRGDLVTRITPTLAAYDMTRRVQLGVNYTPSYEKFTDQTQFDRWDNALTASGTADLWTDHLTLQGTSSISRQIINARGAVTPDEIAIDTNQTTVSTYTVTPTFTQRFGDFAVFQLRDQFGSTSSSAIAPATQNAISGTLTSGSEFNRLQWSAQLESIEMSQSSQSNAGLVVDGVTNPTATGSTSQQTAQVSTAYALNRTVSLLASTGYDRITNSTLLNGNLDNPFGSFGIGLTGSRLQLNVNYNLRYGGEFLSAQGIYDVTARWHLQAQYGESVTTTQQQLIGQAGNLGLLPNGGFINLNNGLPFNPLTNPAGINSGLGNVAFISKSGQFSATGTYDRDSYIFTVTQEQDTSSAANFNQSQLTWTGSYTHDLSPDKHLNGMVDYLHLDQSSPSASSDHIVNASAGFTYDLARDLTASATYALLWRHSSLAGQSVFENAVTIGLRKTF